MRNRRLLRDGVPVPLQHRQFDLLHHFVEHPDTLITTDELIDIVWEGAEVTDSSLTQALFHLRKTLDPKDPGRFIQTVHREGYRFIAPVTRVPAPRRTDAELDAELAPYRGLVEGRAAIETLEVPQILRARAVFERLVAADPENATFHVGLANACVLQFESTRADAAPDTGTLALALTHAREACRLVPDYAEAWATLGFVYERTGDRVNAVAALLKSVDLESDNWHHWVRLASASSGEQRLRAARRALKLAPAMSIACFLIATVYVERDALDLAEGEVRACLAVLLTLSEKTLFVPLGLHWILGLLCLARGDESGALAAFAAELALEPRGHLYGREMAANTWYAIGAVHLRRGDKSAAEHAFREAIARVPQHLMAHTGLAILEGRAPKLSGPSSSTSSSSTVARALAHAAFCVWTSDAAGAAALVAAALSDASPGNAGWLIPIEPLLCVDRDREAWQGVLALLRTRAG